MLLYRLEQLPEFDEVYEVDPTIEVIVPFRERLTGVEVGRQDQKIGRIDDAIFIEVAGGFSLVERVFQVVEPKIAQIVPGALAVGQDPESVVAGDGVGRAKGSGDCASGHAAI